MTPHQAPQITWQQRLDNLRRALGREPTLDEALMAAEIHVLTPHEIEQQRESFGRHNVSTGDPRFD